MFKHLFSSSGYLKIARGCAYILFFLLPLFFLPTSIDVLELNKQTLLIILTFIACLAWIGSMVQNRIFTFRRGWFNLVPVFLFIPVFLSAFFSRNSYVSWAGASSQEYISVLTVAALCAMFYVVANTIVTAAERRLAHALILCSAFLAAVVAMFSLFGAPIFPFAFAKAVSFNTVGTLVSLGVYLSAIVVFASILWVSSRGQSLLYSGAKGLVERALIILLALLTLAVLIVVDFWVPWLILLGGLFFLFVFSLVRTQEFPHTSRFTLPFLLATVSVLFLFWLPSPFAGRVPAEVSVTQKASFSIAKQVLKGRELAFGTGPGTFSHDYATYRTKDLNQTRFWDTRFDRAASFALTLLATTGLVGIVGFLAFVLVAGVFFVRHLMKEREQDEWFLLFALAGGWFTIVLASFFYSFNLTLLFVLFAFLSMAGSVVLGNPVEKKFAQSPRMGLLSSFAFVITSIAIVAVVFLTAQRYMAEAAFAKAVRLDRANGDLNQITAGLDRAARLDRYSDLYERNLAQALLLRVGEEVKKAKDGKELTPQGRQYIQALVASSVNAAARATELAPYNAANWFVRGAIYRELIQLVGGAGDFALQSFKKASELEPNNPAFLTEIGKTHLALAEVSRQLTASKDAAVADPAKKNMDASFASAEEILNKAIEMKTDYAPAHYQLAVMFERQGKLEQAIGKMESVVRYNSLDVGVEFQLGVLYLRRNNKDDLGRAQQMFERVIQLAPSYSNARWFLASIYEQQGNLKSAIEQVKKVLELNPDNEMVKTRLARLESGKTSKEIPLTVEEGDQKATEKNTR